MLRKFVPILVLTLAALACSVAGPGQPTEVPGALETSAAATLTALAPTAVPATETVAAPPATETPTAAPATETPAPFVCAVVYSDFATDTGAGSITCLGSDGAPRVLANANRPTGPVLSSDGTLVAYLVEVSEGINQLWVVSSAGGDARLLVGADQVPNPDPSLINSPGHYEWLAGTHHLVFDTRYLVTPGPTGPGEYINSDLWTVDADSGAISPVLPAGTAGSFATSPDGQTIAISRGVGLDLVNADGSNYRQNVLNFPSIITYSEYTYKPRPQWSADGTFFNVVVPSADPMAADSTAAFYRVAVDGTVTPVGNIAANVVFGGQVNPPFVSPNGTFALYSQGQPDGSGDALTLVEFLPDGGAGVRSITLSPGMQGWGWSPDSALFAYSLFPDGSTGQLFVTGTTAESVQPLAAGLSALRDLEWESSNSFVFLAIIGGGDVWSLYRQTLGSEPVLLAGGLSLNAYMDVKN